MVHRMQRVSLSCPSSILSRADRGHMSNYLIAIYAMQFYILVSQVATDIIAPINVSCIGTYAITG